MSALPPYIVSEASSMLGRPLRGRLWVASELAEPVEVVFERFAETELGRSLSRCGGIVIRDEDAAALRSYPGVVTDLELVRA